MGDFHMMETQNTLADQLEDFRFELDAKFRQLDISQQAIESTSHYMVRS